MTAKEIIEQSDIDKKDVILSRMKEKDFRTHKQIERYETTLSEQVHVIESYRTVLKDMIYSNWLNNNKI